MIDTKICNWLMDNADAPIRYRVARELLKDEQAAKKIEPELLEHKEVQKWLAFLKPNNPPQHWMMEHGCFDFNLENAMPKVIKLGLHGGLKQMEDSIGLYIEKLNSKYRDTPFRGSSRENFCAIMNANFLSLAGIKSDIVTKCMLKSLDEMYGFARQDRYDIYMSLEERDKLSGIPKNWKDTEYFIKPDLFEKHGYFFPLIYDIIGLYGLYDLHEPDVDMKINAVLNYISSNDFHTKICGGYGILVVDGSNRFNGMGWDPQYPGWFDAGEYMEKGNIPKLLFFAEFISHYPIALKTKWFKDLIIYLEKYKNESGIYEFPKEWMPEKSGYAVQGFHMSYGENRRKKIWREIESTFYMQLLQQNI